jgi:predicted nucleic acid-binding protein
MDEFVERLVSAGVAGIDSSIFIYHLEAHPRYSLLTKAALSSMEAGEWRGVTSMIALMEVTVHPWRLEREDVARQYEFLLVHFPNLIIVPIDRDAARVAAQLRARFGLRPPDAFQVAASLVYGAKAFLTNDRRLSSIQKMLEIIVLEDFVEAPGSFD